MTWTHYLNQGRLDRHVPTRQELDDQRGLVARNLQDADIPALSTDNRLALAYEAALVLATIAIACAGYRVKGFGHHKTTFEVLPFAMGPGVQAAADFFERCRRDRNRVSYDVAGVVSVSEAAEALREAVAFEVAVESWVAAHHPLLQKA